MRERLFPISYSIFEIRLFARAPIGRFFCAELCRTFIFRDARSKVDLQICSRDRGRDNFRPLRDTSLLIFTLHANKPRTLSHTAERYFSRLAQNPRVKSKETVIPGTLTPVPGVTPERASVDPIRDSRIKLASQRVRYEHQRWSPISKTSVAATSTTTSTSGTRMSSSDSSVLGSGWR